MILREKCDRKHTTNNCRPEQSHKSAPCYATHECTPLRDFLLELSISRHLGVPSLKGPWNRFKSLPTPEGVGFLLSSRGARLGRRWRESWSRGEGKAGPSTPAAKAASAQDDEEQLSVGGCRLSEKQIPPHLRSGGARDDSGGLPGRDSGIKLDRHPHLKVWALPLAAGCRKRSRFVEGGTTVWPWPLLQLSAGVRPAQRDLVCSAFLFLLRSNRLGALIGDAVGSSVLLWLWLRLRVLNYRGCFSDFNF